MKLICTYCERQFEHVRRVKYCSDECRREEDKRNKRMHYVGKRKTCCDLCGAELPKYKTRFCCTEHKTRWAHIQSGAVSHDDILIKVCVVCGKKFKTWKSREMTCSKACSIEKHNKRLAGKIVDSDITLKKLAERDNQTCKICGQIVDWTDYIMRDGYRITGRKYPSIDHILPISKGGEHRWGNVQLAHMICNSIKNDKIEYKQE